MVGILLVALAVISGQAQDLQFHELRDPTLATNFAAGACKPGYRTYGSRNPARDNAKLLPPWFSGRSSDLAGLISMGGMQAFEWLVVYPGFARRAVPTVGFPRFNAADLLPLNAELSAIEAAKAPRLGLAAALRVHEFALCSPSWLSSPGPDRDFTVIG